jgi:hypothetical protein
VFLPFSAFPSVVPDFMRIVEDCLCGDLVLIIFSYLTCAMRHQPSMAHSFDWSPYLDHCFQFVARLLQTSIRIDGSEVFMLPPQNFAGFPCFGQIDGRHHLTVCGILIAGLLKGTSQGDATLDRLAKFISLTEPSITPQMTHAQPAITFVQAFMTAVHENLKSEAKTRRSGDSEWCYMTKNQHTRLASIVLPFVRRIYLTAESGEIMNSFWCSVLVLTGLDYALVRSSLFLFAVDHLSDPEASGLAISSNYLVSY